MPKTFFVSFERTLAWGSEALAARTRLSKKRAVLGITAAFATTIAILGWFGVARTIRTFAAMQAKMLGPEMIRRGYAPGFSAAVIACAAVITPTG